jgi:lipopolysaccharide/colanic/teichoic acid biosynthesis glycosyltransferase
MAPAGLTGLWQVEERGKGGNMSADERKQLDILYGQTYNFMLDMKIIFRTFFTFVQEENV